MALVELPDGGASQNNTPLLNCDLFLVELHPGFGALEIRLGVISAVYTSSKGK